MWKNFQKDEFRCQCGCGVNGISEDFIDVLQEIRNEFGAPMVISSGYRCHQHPLESAKPIPGEHTEGTCADVLVSHSAAFALLKAAINHPRVTGIGVKQKSVGRFLHIGIGPEKPGRPRPHVWSY